MNEFEIKNVSERFFVESLKDFENGEKDNDAILILLSNLLEATDAEEDVHRDVYLTIDSNEEFSAYSKKLSNLLRLKDAAVWMKILEKVATVGGGIVVGEAFFGLPDWIKLSGGILSFLALMANEGTFVKFNEQDAKILLAISRIGKTFSKKKLRSKLEELNKEFPGKFDIEQNLVERSLKKFVRYGVLDSDTRDDIYVVREKIKPLRQK